MDTGNWTFWDRNSGRGSIACAANHEGTANKGTDMRGGAVGFFKSLFKRRGPATPVSRVPKDVSPEDAVAEAHKALQAVKRSSSVKPEIDEALKRPIPELSRLDFMELRKLAHHAYHGIGTPKDVHKATELWVCAAMKGCPESTYSVAMCFLEGKGCIPKDEAKAVDLLEQLANHKHGWSMFALATILARNNHDKPDGDDKQLARAVALYTAAAEANVTPAMKNLSNFYELGIGTPKDPAAALHWLTRAAKAGDPTAQIVLGRKLTFGEGGVDKDEAQGFLMYNLAASQGNPQGLYNVGCGYFMGKGVGKDLGKAAQYFKQAASAQFFPAMVNLGNMHVKGLGVPKDLKEALKWYKAAAGIHPGHVDELVAYTERLLKGEAVDEDVDMTVGDGSEESGVTLDGNTSAPLSAIGGGDKVATAEFRVSLDRTEAPRETITEK